MNKVKSPSFKSFLSFFPKVELPLTLNDERACLFSSHNKPLSQTDIDHFIGSWESEGDEFTEYVNCCRLKGTKDYDAIIYWKAGLKKYEYILVTIDKKGVLINRKVIASTLIDGEIIKKSLAHITEDGIIQIVAGAKMDTENLYDPANSMSFSMEILPDGEVEFDM